MRLSLALLPLSFAEEVFPNSPLGYISAAFPLAQGPQLWPLSPEELPCPRTQPTPIPPKSPRTHRLLREELRFISVLAVNQPACVG